MARDILNRYIWIVDTIRRYGRISRKELNQCWSRSSLSNGESEIPRRTFFNYRQAIEDLFSLSIECDPSTYEYYIVEPENSDITEWMLNSAATNSVLQGSRDISDRIMLEDVPSAREFLASVMEALRGNNSITFDYHPYTRTLPTRGVTLEPYFLRIHRQLWYVTGRNTGDGKIKTYSLDRMSGMYINSDTFKLPEGTNPKDYFRDSFGIMVNHSQVKDIKLKVEARQAKYFRALPLHASQSEMVGDKYSVFTYRMCITSDFVSELLGYGPNITVVSPPELKAMVVEQLGKSLENYRKTD